MTTLAELVGFNVKRLREQYGWTQSELLLRLQPHDRSWTRAGVGMLESKGVRGERLQDLAGLCVALAVPLSELIDGDKPIEFRNGTRTPEWLESALAGEESLPYAQTHVAGTGGMRRVLNVGEDDPDESRRIGRALDIPLGELRDLVARLSGQRSPTAYRDFLGKVEVTDDRTAAKAKRAQGTRELRRRVNEVKVSPKIVTPKSDADAFNAWLAEARKEQISQFQRQPTFADLLKKGIPHGDD